MSGPGAEALFGNLVPKAGEFISSSSGSFGEASGKTLALYKRFVRAVPVMKRLHRLQVSDDEVRDVIRDQFLRHRDIKDVKVIDLLVFRGHTELMEIMMMHKQTPHLMQYVNDRRKKLSEKDKSFMDEFFEQ